MMCLGVEVGRGSGGGSGLSVV
eukprot:COSAG02_NODE_63703_length_262_cov_1.067485_1_plen_21_part_01